MQRVAANAPPLSPILPARRCAALLLLASLHIFFFTRSAVEQRFGLPLIDAALRLRARLRLRVTPTATATATATAWRLAS